MWNVATPAGFEPARAEHNGLAGHRLNHSAKVSLMHHDPGPTGIWTRIVGFKVQSDNQLHHRTTICVDAPLLEVGFEPTHPKITELESAALDHSAIQADYVTPHSCKELKITLWQWYTNEKERCWVCDDLFTACLYDYYFSHYQHCYSSHGAVTQTQRTAGPINKQTK